MKVAKMKRTALAFENNKSVKPLRLSAPYHLCRGYHLMEIGGSTISKRQAKIDNQNSYQRPRATLSSTSTVFLFAAVAAALMSSVSAFFGSIM